MMYNKKRILLLGASGFTGGLISDLLINENIQFTAAGRDVSRLKEIYKDNKIPLLHIDIHSEESIIYAIKQSDIIINCIGPYSLYSSKILKQVANSKVIYIDISGEQQFILDSFNTYNQRAILNKATIIHSISFESYLAELLADLIIDTNKNYYDISSYYYTRGRVSSGTRLTMRLNPFYKSYIYMDNNLINAKSHEYNKNINLNLLPEITNASFVPYPEVMFFSKRYRTRNAGSYLIVSDFDISIFRNPEDIDPGNISSIVFEERKRKRIYFSLEERKKQTFLLIVNSIDLKANQKNICIKGSDTYGLTAILVTEFIKEILESKNLPFGVFSPISIINSENILKKIQDKALFEFVDAQFSVNRN